MKMKQEIKQHTDIIVCYILLENNIYSIGIISYKTRELHWKQRGDLKKNKIKNKKGDHTNENHLFLDEWTILFTVYVCMYKHKQFWSHTDLDF